MGNFSLKTDDDYVVPEAQRVNAQKKRRQARRPPHHPRTHVEPDPVELDRNDSDPPPQLVLLDESIHAIKINFNERVFALRDLKSRLISSFASDDQRLAEIEPRLPQDANEPRLIIL